MREKHVSTTIGQDEGRITPACAGKTGTTFRIVCLCQDHTRVCGKNRSIFLSSIVPAGSHPRVREKLKRRHHLRRLSRITPACAGKTILDKAYLHLNWDHPRVCGKNHCNSAIHTIYLCAFYVNKADTIADFRKFSQRCFLRSTFFTMIRFPME